MIYGQYYIPGFNVALLFSLALTIAMTLAAIPIAKRRAVGTPLSWGEAMVAAVWVFAVLFLAYGVVPHQWLTHADTELKWTSDKIVIGNSQKARLSFGIMPFNVTFEALRDIVAVVIYVVGLGTQMFVWTWWQKRGATKPTPELPTSSYGRPLVRKG